jgi:adenine phosphoribosyltransferase
MNWEYYAPYMNKKVLGMNRADSSTLFYNSKVFQNLVKDMANKVSNLQFDKIACIDSLGFILGGAMAFKLNKGIVLIRKKGKLPLKKSDLISVSFKDYNNKKASLELNKNLISPGNRILLVDNWIMTGAQMKASIKLIKKAKGKLIGISCIGIEKNSKLKPLFKYNLHYLIEKE